MKKNLLASIEQNFAQWYQDVVYHAKLCSGCSVKGCIVVLPYGYSLWESIQSVMNVKIKNQGARNMAFPLLIPYSYFEKEKDHVEGFAPEVALVTSAGGKKLEDPLVVRPTSEVIIHEYFKNTITSWRDLPLKVNQWCSVVRWEKRPRPFLRTTEFWWQEGHTAHALYQEAYDQAYAMIEEYRSLSVNYLAIPVIVGEKPRDERFAGAAITWTFEGMMQDGKALQMGTSHLLGEGFVDAIGISFQDPDMKVKKPSLTSWGITTRLIGALVMVHGDQKGLVLPPYIAPVLVFIIPIYKNSYERGIILACIEQLENTLRVLSISYNVDRREEVSPGSKFCDADLQGIPFRIDIGIRDITRGEFSLYRRDVMTKQIYDISLFTDSSSFQVLLEAEKFEMHERMLKKASQLRDSRIAFLGSLKDYNCGKGDSNECYNDGEEQDEKNTMNPFFIGYWCQEDYAKIRDKQLTVRCMVEGKQAEYFSFVKEGRKLCCVHEKECFGLQKCIIAKCY